LQEVGELSGPGNLANDVAPAAVRQIVNQALLLGGCIARRSTGLDSVWAGQPEGTFCTDLGENPNKI
jgi:hypothetical protein